MCEEPEKYLVLQENGFIFHAYLNQLEDHDAFRGECAIQSSHEARSVSSVCLRD
jgi:hypothetical protein